MRLEHWIVKVLVIAVSAAATALISLGLAFAIHTTLRPTSSLPRHVEWWEGLNDVVVIAFVQPIAIACWILGVLGALVLIPYERLILGITVVAAATLLAVGVAASIDVFLAPPIGLVGGFCAMFWVRVTYHLKLRDSIDAHDSQPPAHARA